MEDPVENLCLLFQEKVSIYRNTLESQDEASKRVKVDTTSRDFKQFREDIQRAVARGGVKNCPSKHIIVNINMAGESQGKGSAPRRKVIMNMFLKYFSPSLIFCQEPAGHFDGFIDDLTLDYLYDNLPTKSSYHASLIWDTTQLEKVDLRIDAAAALRSLRLRWTTQAETEVTSRTKMMVFQPPGVPGDRFLAASWHGPHTGWNADEKEAAFVALISFLRQVCSTIGHIPFVVGGDFNTDTVTTFNRLYTSIDALNGTSLSLYPLSDKSIENEEAGGSFIPNKENIIFFYGSATRRGLSLRWLRSFDIDELLQKDEVYSQVSPMAMHSNARLLDHPILAGVLHLHPRSTHNT